LCQGSGKRILFVIIKKQIIRDGVFNVYHFIKVLFTVIVFFLKKKNYIFFLTYPLIFSLLKIKIYHLLQFITVLTY